MVDTEAPAPPLSLSSLDVIRLPRAQTGPSPQHLLVTLLGDLWLDGRTPIPASVLMALLAEFEVSPAAARSAINRLVHRGLLDRQRNGRAAKYVLTDRAVNILTQGLTDISAFTVGDTHWDGEWTLAAFSVAESDRDIRSALRKQLRWLGFAPLFDALWVSPHAEPADVARIYGDLGLANASVFRGQLGDGSPLSPVAAWDTEALGEAYDLFHQRHLTELERLAGGQVIAAGALVARTSLMDEWRNFLTVDPNLPDSALPTEWPRARARRTFRELYDGLGDLALLRARQVIGRFDIELAETLSLHSISTSGASERRANA